MTISSWSACWAKASFMSLPDDQRGEKTKLTDGYCANQIFKAITTKHLAKHLFWILEAARWFGHPAAVLLSKFIVFLPQLGI